MCSNIIAASSGPVICGEWAEGIKQLCDKCHKQAEEAYPQGWRYYPGDLCKHGKYVGGSGIDHMCGYCELE